MSVKIVCVCELNFFFVLRLFDLSTIFLQRRELGFRIHMTDIEIQQWIYYVVINIFRLFQCTHDYQLQ
jgi:hypothetical protein